MGGWVDNSSRQCQISTWFPQQIHPSLHVTIAFRFSVSKKVLEKNKNFKPPEVCKFNLSGKPLKEKMIKILEKLYNDKIILDHGMEVGKELANVLSGGDTTIEKTLSEDDLYKLELDSFMKLIQTKKTQERIKYTLATGKPLVN